MQKRNTIKKLNYKLLIFVNTNISGALFTFCFLMVSSLVLAQQQFQTYGSATIMGGDCYQMTPDAGNQNGSVWSPVQINLNQSFEVQFDLNLGIKDANGADGIVLVFQQMSPTALCNSTQGGSIGFGGILPSLGIEFDTYQNSYDPVADHIAIMRDGNSDHTNVITALAAPVTIPNIEDGLNHRARAVWNAQSQTLQVFYECNQLISYTGNIVANIFGGNPIVWWGFTAATGGLSNIQQVCMVYTSFVNANQNVTICSGNNGQLFAATFGVNTLYSWTPVVGLSCTNCQNPVASPTTTTTYLCQITDPCGFQRMDTFVVNVATLSATSAQTDVSCNGGNNGSATINVTGGTFPYLFQWSSGGMNATENNLAAGNYTCTVTDANGCSITQPFTISEPSAITATSTQNDVTCNAGNNGSATINANGGTPAYSYAWIPSGGTNATENNLVAGNYTCAITDANGCTIAVSFTISQSPALTVFSSTTPATCGGNNGTATINPSGGTGAYTYVWSPAPGAGQGTPNATGLFGGSYTCTVTDSAGCVITASANVNNIGNPVANISACTNVSCFGGSNGSVTINVTSGTPAYTYAWVPSGGTNATENNLTAGNYTCAITDANGCITSTSVSLTQPSQLTTTYIQTNVTCNAGNNGNATVNVSGGTQPYTYSWSPSGGTSATANNLIAGTYMCVVSDNAVCTYSFTAVITEPTQLNVSATNPGPVICNGQNAQLGANATGGTVAYTFTWQPGNLNGATPNVTPITTTTYTISVTDANGCTAADSEAVIVNPIPTTSFIADNTIGCAPLCINYSDLSTIASPSTINSWSWNFGDGGASNSQNPNHCYTIPGTYNVTLAVATNGGCGNTLLLNNYITVIPNPTAAFTSFPTHVNISDPTVHFTDQSTGATAWNWNFGDVMNSGSALQNFSFIYPDTGCYKVKLNVSNASGCTDSTTADVCILPDWMLYIPNCFTPDDNGVNDIFMPIGLGIDEDHFEMWIFDRWGNLVFQTEDFHKGWNGRAMNGNEIVQVDTYVYKINCQDEFGGLHNYIGKVSVIK